MRYKVSQAPRFLNNMLYYNTDRLIDDQSVRISALLGYIFRTAFIFDGKRG